MSQEYLQMTAYMDETDMSGDTRLYEAIVRRLLQRNIAGATVLRGMMGYGRHHMLHREGLFGVSDDRPIVVIVVDENSKIRGVVNEIRALIKEGIVTLHSVEMVPKRET